MTDAKWNGFVFNRSSFKETFKRKEENGMPRKHTKYRYPYDNELIEKYIPRLNERFMMNVNHYIKAVKKHPFFAQRVLPSTVSDAKVADMLSLYRDRCSSPNASAKDLLDCEIWEAMEAFTEGRFEDCREEIRDSIAVLERMDDMIVGIMNERGKGL